MFHPTRGSLLNKLFEHSACLARLEEEWKITRQDIPWRDYDEIVVNEKVFFHGNFRLRAVRITQLLLVPEQVS